VYNADDTSITLEFDELHTVWIGDRGYYGETIEIPLNEVPEGEITLEYERTQDIGPYRFYGNSIQKNIYVDTTKPNAVKIINSENFFVQQN
jgi:hypothetical protein